MLLLKRILHSPRDDFQLFPNDQNRFTVAWSCSQNLVLAENPGKMLLTGIASDYAGVDGSELYLKFVV